MQAVILAGGKGTRLHPLTTHIPKPMVPLFDRPVMEHCIRLLIKHGITNIIVTVSYLAEDIMEYFGDGSKWGVNIRYSVENEPLGTAGGVKLVQSMVKETFVVVSGDAVTDFDLTAAIEKHKSASAAASLMLYEVEDPTQFGLVERDSKGRITRFLEKPKSNEVFTNTVNTGIYILEPEVLSQIPGSQVFDFARDLFPRMLNNSDALYGFPLPGYWCDIGNLVQYRNCHFDALQGKVHLDIPAVYAGEGIWLGEGVNIHSSVDIASPVYIGSGATIRRNANLGKNAIIGAGALVEEGARVSASVIGSQSLIGRGTNISDSILGDGYIASESDNVFGQALVADVPFAEPLSASPVYSSKETLAQLAHRQLHTERSAA